MSILLLALSSGCNGDVFLDESPLPDETISRTIDGDGGEVSIVIPTECLEHLGLDIFSESLRYYTVYNAAGDIIDPYSPASEIARIVFANDFKKFELIKDGDILTARSICNPSGYAGWSIRLEYSYGPRFIDINTTPGKPIKLLSVDYSGELQTQDRADVITNRFGFNNSGPVPQFYEVRPYLNAFASILVEPDRSDIWMPYELPAFRVPVYVDGEWKLVEKSGLRRGVRYTYEGPDRMTVVRVTIPAETNADIYSDIIYSKAVARGTMTFLNEILDIRKSVDFSVTSYYPVNYEIRVEDVR